MRLVTSINRGIVIFVMGCLLGACALTMAQEDAVPQDVQDWAAAAKEAGQQKDYDAAVQFLSKIIDAYPQTKHAMQAQSEIAVAHIESGNKEMAKAALEMMWSYQGQPEAVPLMKRIARRYSRRGYSQEAIALNQRLLEAIPDQAAAPAILRNSILDSLGIGNTVDAAAGIEELLTVHGDHERTPGLAMSIAWKYRELKKPSEAIALYTRLLEEYPGTDFAKQAQHAITVTYIQSGNKEMAVTALERMWIYQDHENFARSMGFISTVFRKAGYSQEDLSLNRRLVDMFPEDESTPRRLRYIIQCHLSDNNMAAAEVELERLLTAYTGNEQIPELGMSIAWKYRLKNDYGKALEIYLRLLREYPHYEKAIEIEQSVISVYLDMGAKDMADARVEKLVTEYGGHPSLPTVLNGAGDAYRRHGYYTQAIRQFEAALARNPNDTEKLRAHTGRGQCSVRLGNQEAADECIGIILAKFIHLPEAARGIFLIGEEYYFMGADAEQVQDTTLAQHAFLQAVEIWEQFMPQALELKNPGFPYFTAIALQRAGKHNRAKDYFRIVIDRWPDYDRRQHAMAMLAECYDVLKHKQEIPISEANRAIREAYTAMIDDYPDSRGVELAKEWLIVHADK